MLSRLSAAILPFPSMVYGRDGGLEFVPRAVLPGGVGLSMRDVGSIEGGEVTVYKEDQNKEMLVVGQTPNIMCLITSTLIR